eukprot:m.671231 g.671231  ORF g.671231 m.671231 type:complete len:160 (+) comp22769_c0_seq40:1932-2411(+)
MPTPQWIQSNYDYFRVLSYVRRWVDAVLTMKKHERASFLLRPAKAYGSRGTLRIPPNSALAFEIELFEWVAPPSSDICSTASPTEDASSSHAQSATGSSSDDTDIPKQVHSQPALNYSSCAIGMWGVLGGLMVLLLAHTLGVYSTPSWPRVLNIRGWWL